MTPYAVQSLLRDHEDDLKTLGVLTLSIIGSTARHEAAPGSDVDLAVRLSDGPKGLAHLRRMDALRDHLAGLLGCPVDLIEEPTRSHRVQNEINRDRVLAFSKTAPAPRRHRLQY